MVVLAGPSRDRHEAETWSDFVGSWELIKFGPPTKTTEKRSLAREPHDRVTRLAAKAALKYPPVRFDEVQRIAIASGLADAVEEAGYVVRAGCVGFDHSHLVVEQHERTIEQTARHLKSKATIALTRSCVHPLRDYVTSRGTIPTPWTARCWSVFVNDDAQLVAAIRYVEHHPMKEGLPPQLWSFVTPLLA